MFFGKLRYQAGIFVLAQAVLLLYCVSSLPTRTWLISYDLGCDQYFNNLELIDMQF